MTKTLLSISSLLNATICYFAFWVMVFATSPHMGDVTMRIGFYVLNLIAAAALVAVFGPWILAHRNRNKIAIFVAVLPMLLFCLAVLAFLTLDSWLNKAFAMTTVGAAPVAFWVEAAERATS